MIIAIFGKKGSGKTTLSYEFMYKIGGRVVFLSPVEAVRKAKVELWTHDDISLEMSLLKPGQVAVVRRADTEAFDLMALTAMVRMDYTLIIDEMDRFDRAGELPDLIHYSRHCRVNIIANTRRYVHMPRLLTSQADMICIFRTNEPIDMEYFRRYTDVKTDLLGSLPEFHYLIYPSYEVHKTNPIY